MNNPISSADINKPSILRLRNKELAFGMRTYVMGIVNITPDSFSQDGIVDTQEAVSYALKQIEKGADLIDIGGQSTRPGHNPIDEETEIKRTIPVIAALRKVSDVIISVDTFSLAVLERAIGAGADMLNSIWGLTDELLPIIKNNKLPVVIMHNKTGINGDHRNAGSASLAPTIRKESQHSVGARVNAPIRSDDHDTVGAEPTTEKDIVSEVIDYLTNEAEKASAAGLSREQIILDPGIGFGKTADDNLELLTHFKKIKALGFPTLVGTSRKSTIGKLIDRPVDQRVFGTAATVAFAIAQLVDIVRVHDVEEIVDVVRVSDALVRNWRPDNWDNS